MKQRKNIACKARYAVTFLVMLFIARNVFAVSHYESFNIYDLVFSVEERGYDKVKMAGLLVTMEKGEPELPVKVINLIIPRSTEVDDIAITVDQQTMEGHYFINPSPGPVPVGNIPEPIEPDSAIYNSSNIFPKKCVEVLSHGYFDGTNRIVSVAIYPVQYIPADRIVKFNRSINFSLSFTSSDPPVAYPKPRTQRRQKKIENALKSIVVNDNDISTYVYRSPISKTMDGDDIDFVIIGPSGLESAFSDVIAWKSRRGLKIKYESLSNIYTNYTSGDN